MNSKRLIARVPVSQCFRAGARENAQRALIHIAQKLSKQVGQLGHWDTHSKERTC
jgi:hypothetical protein